MKKLHFIFTLTFLIGAFTLNAQQDEPLKIKMTKDYQIAFDRMPDSGKIIVDLSAVDLRNQEKIENILKLGESPLSKYTDIDFKKKTAILLLNSDFQLPEKWTLDHWNAYFKQLSNIAKNYAKLKYDDKS